MIKSLKIVLSLCLMACSFVVYAVYPASIQKETAAYVYGSQTVEVSLSQIASLMNPEAARSVWGR